MNRSTSIGACLRTPLFALCLAPFALGGCGVFGTGNSDSTAALTGGENNPPGQNNNDPNQPPEQGPACEALMADLEQCHQQAALACEPLQQGIDDCYRVAEQVCQDAFMNLDACMQAGQGPCDAEEQAVDACHQGYVDCEIQFADLWQCYEVCEPIEQQIQDQCIPVEPCEDLHHQLEQCYQAAEQNCGPDQQAVVVCYEQAEAGCENAFLALEACEQQGGSCEQEHQAVADCHLAFEACDQLVQGASQCFEQCHMLEEQIAELCQPEDPCDQLRMDIEQCHQAAAGACEPINDALDQCYADVDQRCADAMMQLDACLQSGQGNCEQEHLAVDACHEGFEMCREWEEQLMQCFDPCADLEMTYEQMCGPEDPCQAMWREVEICWSERNAGCQPEPGPMACQEDWSAECYDLADLLAECYGRPGSDCSGIEGLLAICVEGLAECRNDQPVCGTECEDLEQLAFEVCESQEPPPPPPECEQDPSLCEPPPPECEQDPSRCEPPPPPECEQDPASCEPPPHEDPDQPEG